MIKKGVKVKILAGKDKNKEGEIIEIDRSNNSCLLYTSDAADE